MWHRLSIFYRGEQKGETLLNALPAFATGRISFGSSEECNLRLRFAGVEPVHGYIDFNGGRAFIESAEGAKLSVRGLAAEKSELTNNCRIDVGEEGLVLVYYAMSTVSMYAVPQPPRQGCGAAALKQQSAEKQVFKHTAASFWQRFAAWLVDMAALGVATSLINCIFQIITLLYSPISRRVVRGWLGWEGGWVLIWLLAGLIYYTLLESSTLQATIGKLAVGLKVTDSGGMRIGFEKSLLRNLAKLVPAVLAFLGFLTLRSSAYSSSVFWVLAVLSFVGFLTIYGEGATLYDRITGCKVVMR